MKRAVDSKSVVSSYRDLKVRKETRAGAICLAWATEYKDLLTPTVL